MIGIVGVGKSFGPVRALDGVTLNVRVGGTVALLGPNGSGKTTLLKIVAGLVRPDSGHVRVAGRLLKAGDRETRSLVGFVPQRASFPGSATPRSLLVICAALRGLGPEAAERTLDRLDLAVVGHRRIREISGGMQQRLAIAQALVGDPPILLMDEPTTGLDPAAAGAFRSLIHALQREGKTIILSTHLLDEVERLAERAAFLAGGRLVGVEPIHVDRPSHREPSDLERTYLRLIPVPANCQGEG